jgi:hypothetical protein
MYFFAPPMIAVMQTGLLIATGMQSMMLPTTVSSFQSIGFLAERERDGRCDHGESPIADSRPGVRFSLAGPFEELPRAKGAWEEDTSHGL